MIPHPKNITPLGRFESPPDENASRRKAGVASCKTPQAEQTTREMVHDLKNILTPILGYTQLILHDMPADDAQYRRIEKIQRAALSAHEMVLHVLDETPEPSQLQPLDVNEQIRALSQIIDGILPDDIQLKLDLSAEDGKILAEVKDLRRVLMNLISNASQAMPEGGTLMIQTARVSCSPRLKDSQDIAATPIDAIRISVRDTGNGIPSSGIERIFELGYTTKVGGNGLGLACVQRIAKHYGGWVEVDSIPNVGTAIHIFLPRCPAAAATSLAV